MTEPALVRQLNEQLLVANAALETSKARCRDLERQVAELMCWQVHAFADGELDAERADAFRLHLAGCERCHVELVQTTQLTARLGELAADDRAAEAAAAALTSRATPCTDFAPAGFAGRWQRWHRGHGCNLDDGKPRTPQDAGKAGA